MRVRVMNSGLAFFLGLSVVLCGLVLWLVAAARGHDKRSAYASEALRQAQRARWLATLRYLEAMQQREANGQQRKGINR